MNGDLIHFGCMLNRTWLCHHLVGVFTIFLSMPVCSVSIEHSLLYIDSSFRMEVRSTCTLAMILLHRGMNIQNTEETN